MSEITEKTNLMEYPLLLLISAEKGYTLSYEKCIEIWDSLTEEEKATNKDYKAEYEAGLLTITKNNELVKVLRLV